MTSVRVSPEAWNVLSASSVATSPEGHGLRAMIRAKVRFRFVLGVGEEYVSWLGFLNI